MRCVERPAGIQGRPGPGVPGLDSGVVYRLDAEVVSGVPLGLAQPGLRGELLGLRGGLPRLAQPGLRGGLPGLASGGLPELASGGLPELAREASCAPPSISSDISTMRERSIGALGVECPGDHRSRAARRDSVASSLWDCEVGLLRSRAARRGELARGCRALDRSPSSPCRTRSVGSDVSTRSRCVAGRSSESPRSPRLPTRCCAAS